MDKIIRATAADGYVKMTVITAKNMVEKARCIHSTSPTATAALGRALCAVSMLGNAMKEENASVTLRIAGNGPLNGIVAVSDFRGWARGYVGNSNVDLPLRPDGKLNVGAAVGKDGILTISRDIGLVEPYISSVKLVSGEIAEDITSYLLESEQVPSACGLGVLVDTDKSVKAAGGFIVQLMPGADESLTSALEDNIFMMDQLTTILDEDGADEIFVQILKGLEYHIVSEDEVRYYCGCNREKVADALVCLDESEINDIVLSDREIEVSCQFCDKVYTFTPSEIVNLKPKSK